MKQLLWIGTIVASLLTEGSCVTNTQARYGIQTDQLAHIPSRIAVLPCTIWPQGARFDGQPAIELKASELQPLCEHFDRYVLQSFDGQPYMRGLSPRVVTTLLEKSQQSKLLPQLEELWTQPGPRCENCTHPGRFYQETMVKRETWRSWLNQFSAVTRSSDALLIPFVAHARSGELDDRGLFYAQREAMLLLFLIDTNDGRLIWLGGRETEVRKPLEKHNESLSSDQFPSWDDLWTRLFTEDLWREFPGRQS